MNNPQDNLIQSKYKEHLVSTKTFREELVSKGKKLKGPAKGKLNTWGEKGGTGCVIGKPGAIIALMSDYTERCDCTGGI